MNGSVFHSVSVEYDFWCLFNSEFQVLLNLIWSDITSQEQQVFVICQFVSQMIKQVNEIFADFLLSSVQEQDDILISTHSFLKIITCQFFLLCCFLSLFIGWPFVFLYFLNELSQWIFGMRLVGNKHSLCLPINSNDILLIINSKCPQGSFVLRMLGTQIQKHHMWMLSCNL